MARGYMFGERYIECAASLIYEFESLNEVLDADKGDRNGRARDCLKNLLSTYRSSLKYYLEDAESMKQLLEHLPPHSIMIMNSISVDALKSAIACIQEAKTKVDEIIKNKGF